MEYELIFLGYSRLIRIFTQLALVCLQRSLCLKSSLPLACEAKRTGDAVRAPLPQPWRPMAIWWLSDSRRPIPRLDHSGSGFCWLIFS